MAGLCAPLSTLRRHPRGYRRMTRGQCGSLHLHCERLALSTPCRSSRRTKNHESTLAQPSTPSSMETASARRKAEAVTRVVAWQLSEEMKHRGMTKADLAERMN